jgi:hypothetical protein
VCSHLRGARHAGRRRPSALAIPGDRRHEGIGGGRSSYGAPHRCVAPPPAARRSSWSMAADAARPELSRAWWRHCVAGDPRSVTSRSPGAIWVRFLRRAAGRATRRVASMSTTPMPGICGASRQRPVPGAPRPIAGPTPQGADHPPHRSLVPRPPGAYNFTARLRSIGPPQGERHSFRFPTRGAIFLSPP